MLAAKQGCMECVTLLLRMGADPRLRSKNGQTALEMALSAGNTDIGELLEQAEKITKEHRAIE
jgi:ankyrin repeat protein